MSMKIVADSSADLFKLDDVDFVSVAMRVVTDERDFSDNENLNTLEMMEYMEKYTGKSGSACPGVGDYLLAFGEAEEIFCVTITSGLSGSFNAARAAAMQYEEAHEGRRVYVIDTKSTGPESALIVMKLRDMIQSGLSFDVIVYEIEKYRRHTHLIFCLQSLHNLAANGRANPVVAKLAGFLGIRVIGQASLAGELEMLCKSRGGERAIADIIKHMKENGYRGGAVRIHHAENPRAALVLKKRLLAEFEGAQITLSRTHGLCSFYAERGGLLVGFEGARKRQEKTAK